METNSILGIIIAVLAFIIYRLIVKNKELKADKKSLSTHNELLLDLTTHSFESATFLGDFPLPLLESNRFIISNFFAKVLEKDPDTITEFINSLDDINGVDKQSRLSGYLSKKIQEVKVETLANIVYYNTLKYLERLKSRGLDLEKNKFQAANLIILSTITDKAIKNDFISALEKLVIEFLSTQGKPGGSELEEWQDGPKKELLKSEWIKIKLYLK